MQRRKGLHRAVGEAIEDLYQGPAGGARRGVGASFRAGRGLGEGPGLQSASREQALAQSAHREAVGSFEQALSALPHLPEQPDTRAQAIDLRLALRSALWPSSDFGRILTSLREAEALAAALDDPRRLGQVSGLLAEQFRFMGAYDQAIAAAQRALALATASGDVVLRALAYRDLGLAYQAQGDYRQAIDSLGQTVTALEAAPRTLRPGHPARRGLPCLSRLVPCRVGTFAEGRILGDEGLPRRWITPPA